MRNERRAWLAVSVVGAWVVWYATSHGVGVSTDSMSYLRGAEHIARGDGYTMVAGEGAAPIDHWPPLYSIVIAIPIAAGASTTDAARAVNALSMFALLYLAALLVRRLSVRGAAPPLVAMAALLITPVVLRNHVMAWSEALFIPLVLAGLVAMHDYFARDRVRDLVIAGACFGLAAVDRYSGVAFVAAIAASLLVRDLKHAARTRFLRPLAFGAVAGLPTALWLVRNLLASERAHDRPFHARMISVDHARAAIDSVSLWLLPSWIPLWARAAWMVAAGMLLAFVLGRNRAGALKRIGRELSGRRRFWALVGVCVAVYLGFVLVTTALFDFDVQFDTRMMSPVYVLVVVLAAATAGGWLARPASWPARAIGGAGIASVVLTAAASATYVRAAHDDAAQYAGARWRNAHAWEIVRAAPESVRVYSTSPYVSAYFVDRAATPFPSTPAATDSASLAAYRAQVGAIAAEVEDENAYLLVYPTMGDTGSALDAARSALHAHAVDSTDVVVLYRLAR